MHNGTKKWSLLLAILACITVCAGCSGGVKKRTHIHAWYGKTTKEATCEQAGLKEYRCECGDVKSLTIEPLRHDMQAVEAVSATCLQSGSTAGETCARCGFSTVETILTTGHQAEIVAGVAATCTESGLTNGEKCSVCDETLQAQEAILAIGHQWVKEEKPTDGIWYYQCENCGERQRSGSETHTHEYDRVYSETAATCVTAGSRILECECGMFKTETLLATGHRVEIVAGVAATCTKSGLTDGEKCSVCGETLTEQERIEPKGHQAEKVTGVAATCTENGLTDGEKCAVCGETLQAQEVVSASGHAWNEGEETENGVLYTCGKCGKTEEVEEETHTHAFDEVASETEATCTKEGERILKCVCGEEKRETVAAKGHQAEIVMGVAATCTESGLTDGEKCSVCDEILKEQEPTEPTGHSYADGECTACGAEEPAKEQELPIANLIYSNVGGEMTCVGVEAGEVARKIVIADTHQGQPVVRIADGAFQNCYTLNSVTIGKNITSFGAWSFNGCRNLVEVYNYSGKSLAPGQLIGGEEPSFIAANAKDVHTSEDAESRLSVDQNGFITYVGADEVTLVGYMGEEKNLILPDGVTAIQPYVFATCDGLESVIIADTVKALTGNTFADCTALKKVTVGSGVVTIERYAFNGATALTEIVMKATAGWTANGVAIAEKDMADPAKAKTVVLEKTKEVSLKRN
ncbi:MAG: leucine-rich repeat domain-containing protein [Clostridia bacterium]|nr:leucine-rich repeat domain-containing protein [Clostridia bacterium]